MVTLLRGFSVNQSIQIWYIPKFNTMWSKLHTNHYWYIKAYIIIRIFHTFKSHKHEQEVNFNTVRIITYLLSKFQNKCNYIIDGCFNDQKNYQFFTKMQFSQSCTFWDDHSSMCSYMLHSLKVHDAGDFWKYNKINLEEPAEGEYLFNIGLAG